MTQVSGLNNLYHEFCLKNTKFCSITDLHHMKGTNFTDTGILPLK